MRKAKFKIEWSCQFGNDWWTLRQKNRWFGWEYITAASDLDEVMCKLRRVVTNKTLFYDEKGDPCLS